MKTRAAVAVAAGKPLEIMEVDLEGPREGEVLVEVKATGICGSDAKIYFQGHREVTPPQIIGHEVAGTVMEVGSGVTGVTEGDRINLTTEVTCGRCSACRNSFRFSSEASRISRIILNRSVPPTLAQAGAAETSASPSKFNNRSTVFSIPSFTARSISTGVPPNPARFNKCAANV